MRYWKSNRLTQEGVVSLETRVLLSALSPEGAAAVEGGGEAACPAQGLAAEEDAGGVAASDAESPLMETGATAEQPVARAENEQQNLLVEELLTRIDRVDAGTDTAQGKLTYQLRGAANWPEKIRDQIVKAMDQAVEIYNKYGRFEKVINVQYNANVKTADGNVNGTIRFGGQISTRTALHEISHTLGIGASKFEARRKKDANGKKQFEGEYSAALLQHFNGENAKLGTDNSHFWPYGLNQAKEDSAQARKRHVVMVEAIARDSGYHKWLQINRQNVASFLP